MSIPDYLENIGKRYALGNATEHTFRGDLQRLLETLVPEIHATNEPKRIECGAPDYVITRKQIPVGYIEAKDVGKDLDAKDLKEQFDRYRDALDNLVFTDYLDFRFYINGQPTASIKIGEVRIGKIVALPENFDQFTNLIKEFCSRKSVTIKSAKTLAEMMAEKAKILAFIIRNALDEDIAAGRDSDLTDQMKAFSDILIHDIDAKAFADIYAQTIAYGMFAARLHDKELDTFSRQEAAEKIPKTNPFLRKLFQFIAAFDLDTRIDWIVDALADLFRATDIAAILKNFGKSTQTHDPIMHFYETFLAEYDPKLRKSRGVFYTPEPVVDFIVRAVDDILKTEFNLPNGLADTSKVKVKEKTPVVKKGKGTVYEEVEKEYHKVQILDPATGTGTFLATVIKHIYRRFENQQGVWNQYVDEHLIPRLNGFELLMASYAMAHLKLDLLLSETGYKSEPGAVETGSPRRFQVYLTNALEEYHPDTGKLFASWLSAEANEANHIKRDTPVMVVIGNPPYSVSSHNKSEWIEDLILDYKKGLDEKSYNSLSDDYVKFIKFGQYFVEKNRSGVLAYITNNSFTDGIVFRQMRRNLLFSFDSIYIVNLHGNNNKKETAPDGSTDQNVFDIRQGVSINIFVKKTNTKSDHLAKVYHFDLYGQRDQKYEFLNNNSLITIPFNELQNIEPNYFFVEKDFTGASAYYEGFSIDNIFNVKAAGIKTHRDAILIGLDSNDVRHHVENFLSNSQSNKRFESGKNNRIVYRPFDHRIIYYDTDLVVRHRYPQIKHSLSPNVSLLTGRQTKNKEANHFFISNTLSEMKTAESSTGSYHFPLYFYPDDNAQQTLDGRTKRVPNLNPEIVEKIGAAVGLTFVAERVGSPRVNKGSTLDEDPAGALTNVRATDTASADLTFAPIDILDYIYAVLHSPSYREKYKEFLKIDFPRVPYPKDAATFWQLVALGGELRQIHLLESPTVSKFITGFPVGGDNMVEKPRFTNPVAIAPGSDLGRIGDVYFNSAQYFSGVPEIAWNFYIGGYQPAQKWLKDRKGRSLSYDDINHYQKIIVALTETDRLMKEIDKVDLIS